MRLDKLPFRMPFQRHWTARLTTEVVLIYVKREVETTPTSVPASTAATRCLSTNVTATVRRHPSTADQHDDCVSVSKTMKLYSFRDTKFHSVRPYYDVLYIGLYIYI